MKQGIPSSTSSEPEKEIKKRRLVKKSSLPVAELDCDGEEREGGVFAFDEEIQKMEEETAGLAGQEKEADPGVINEDGREDCVVEERITREESESLHSQDDQEKKDPIIRSMSPEF